MASGFPVLFIFLPPGHSLTGTGTKTAPLHAVCSTLPADASEHHDHRYPSELRRNSSSLIRESGTSFKQRLVPLTHREKLALTPRLPSRPAVRMRTEYTAETTPAQGRAALPIPSTHAQRTPPKTAARLSRGAHAY